ncbi:hypothetical protein Rsub_04469 [Raphidocelis subcapitata]|uniref:Gamma-interferon-inducible lysosomal thiol reductase n=1 Tax=Raphidocelis subcapitata TaxID=307507 RepID=A0A2V0NZL7_9CHLO|nr:hypothetical protein Rsub_04469 [Raphidocelis subcapitata]|eukprot:GBF92122.1 hypothetical protein Rsub_04469 [Raphidocelis subcapitata]
MRTQHGPSWVQRASCGISAMPVGRAEGAGRRSRVFALLLVVAACALPRAFGDAAAGTQAPKPAPAAGTAPAAAASAATSAAAPASAAPPGKVLMELFIMSYCPDAYYCLNHLAPVLEKLHPIVHVRTEYITRPSLSGAATCLHGPAECAGNSMALCVRDNTPPARNYEGLFKFLLCAHEGDPGSRTTVNRCLDSVGASGAPRKAIDACLDSGRRGDLLARSAAVPRSRGIARSCTIAIEGVQRCVRDGGEWYSCGGGSEEEDFAASLCAAYTAKTGAAAPAGLCPAPAAAASGAPAARKRGDRVRLGP